MIRNRTPSRDRHRTSRVSLTATVALTGLLTIGGFAIGTPPASAASTGSGTVQGTEGVGLNVRPGPSSSSGSALALLPEGTPVTIDCYVHGETIAGYWYTSSLWQHITSPVEGYITDTYLYTGVDGPIGGVPECGGGAAAAPGPAATPMPPTNITYLCNNSDYVVSVTVQEVDQGTVFRIEPTGQARWLAHMSSTAWSNVKDCVPDYDLGDNLASQWECHADLSLPQPGTGWSGGVKWDLESWRSAQWDLATWIWEECNWDY